MLRVGGRGATASRRAWLLQSDGRPHVHLHCERALAETEESFTPGGGVVKVLKLYLAFIGLCNRHGRLQRPASCAPASLERTHWQQEMPMSATILCCCMLGGGVTEARAGQK